MEKEKLAMIHHCRMGHVAFDKMSKVFPNVMSEVDKNTLSVKHMSMLNTREPPM